jgi:hypothetical protein
VPADRDGVPAARDGVPGGRYVVPADRDGVPAGRYDVSAGRDDVPGVDGGENGGGQGKPLSAGEQQVPAGPDETGDLMPAVLK